MKKLKSIFIFLMIVGFGTQPIQPAEQSTHHWSKLTNHFMKASNKTLIAYSAVASLGALHIYKKYIAPRIFKVENIVTKAIELTDRGAEALGSELALAVKNNNFVDEFYWGVSTACSQNESDVGTSTISDTYIQEHLPEGKKWIPLGDGCLADKCWEDDNAKVQNLGCNMYRFSIDWSRVQPAENIINTTELERYKSQCTDLIAKGITPMICFHHYCDPIWFIEKGGFEQEENIHLFVEFCERIVQELGSIGVQYWLVMNQPLAYINKGYLDGSQPPFKTATITKEAILTGKAMATANTVRKNIFQAHVDVSQTIKAISSDHQVGFSHQITPMKAGRYWSIDPIIAHFADNFYNQTFLDFAKKERKHLDFIALSFYSPTRLTLFDIGLFPPKFKIANMHAFWNSEAQGNKTDDPRRIIDGQGFYDAVKRVADTVGKEMPIIVIESGVDVKNETDRKNYFNKTMSAIVKTLKAGYNLKGFCVWTLMDNYEWGKGYDAHFGLYSRRTSENTGELKAGGAYYKDIITAFNS